MMHGYEFGAQGWLLMLALMTAMTILTVFVVIMIVRAARSGSTENSARSVLDQRYARGEISTDEHQERRRQLDPE